MKKKNILKVGLILFIAIFMGSCEKWIDPDINTDPSSPEDVPMNLLLPSAQVQIGYQVGGDLMYPAAMWIQHISGVSRQALAYERYNFTEGDINNVWRWGLYTGPLMNLKIIMDKAEESNSPHFAGVAKVLMAFSIGTMTDVWNDIPYSEAFKGTENLTPSFDKQQQLYSTINTLLNEAITDLQATDNDIALDGDLIYSTDLNAWLKAAYSLKARYALHLSKVNGYQPVVDAINAGGGFTSNADDLEVNFGTLTTEANPIYQFVEQRDDIRVGKLLIDSMLAAGDPRLPGYATLESGAYVGSGPGEANTNASDFGDFYASINSPVPLMTYVEYKFIEAEALFETNDKAGAATAYNDAVMASLNKMGVAGDSTTFEANYANEDQNSITKEKIMFQKYVALYLQLETFADWRRTNIPNLTAAQNNVTNNVVPRRYPYPTSEKVYNAANVPSVKITDKVWWDQ